jgi:hypothetical protein
MEAPSTPSAAKYMLSAFAFQRGSVGRQLKSDFPFIKSTKIYNKFTPQARNTRVVRWGGIKSRLAT